ncbi:SDR family NAD(P)-dependent oxidoreductase [Limosilactobacillus kribbianus]|uniref:SDR family NAD(P)-dependent oxidoreductase n=1 Tax=Limosilactobacillus kribbianus TaxID=2982695 RepID=UPI002264BFC7|nr:SDR family oxidoreductase [Limosilactobacillus kribbianus]
MTQKLTDRVALITGAASGMGKITAELFAREGAFVYIGDRDQKQAEQVVEKITNAGGQADFLKLDVTSEEDWQAAVQKLDRLDILVNNAGIDTHSTLEAGTLADWNQTLAVNLTGPMLGMKATLPLLKESDHASVVNIGSMAGEVGHPFTAYSTSKWGVRGLTKSAAYLFEKYGIRVNAVHPGLVHTPLVAAMYDKFAQAIPGGRGAEPIEIARVTLFLASDDSQYINATDQVVDNGATQLGLYKGIMRNVNQD